MIAWAVAAVLMSTSSAASARDDGYRVSAATIEESVRARLRERLRVAGREGVALRMAGRIEDQSVPEGEMQVRVGEVAGRWPRPRAGVPVQLLVDGRAVRSMTVWVETQDMRNVLTYVGNHPAFSDGERVGLIAARVDMSCCAGEPLGSASELRELRLKRGVRAGQPAMASDFEPRPDVVARQSISVDVVRGKVRLSVPGLALRDARVGEWVPVRFENDGRRTVKARVIGEMRVQIDE